MIRLWWLASVCTFLSTPVHADTIGLCGSGKRITCVVDGDTFWFKGVKIRIADIDTPEITQPKCAYERIQGKVARDRLMSLLNEGPFQLETLGRDEDRNGRKLRVVVRSGKSLGSILVTEGLAQTWDGRRQSWCY